MNNNITSSKYSLAKDLNKIFGKEVLNTITIHGSVVQISVKDGVVGSLEIEPELYDQPKVEVKVDGVVVDNTIDPSEITIADSDIMGVELSGDIEIELLTKFDLEFALSIGKKKELDLYCTPFGYELDGRKSLKVMKEQLGRLIVDKEDVE
jgi:hypothetical protein